MQPLSRFFTFGANHKCAPLSLRESLYLNAEELTLILPKIKQEFELLELAILSTCNRLEIYGVHKHENTDFQSLLNVFYATQKFSNKISLKSPHDIEKHTFFYNGKEAVQHLFQVASSLDSLIVGETQITGQFKNAFSLAHRVSTLGPHLHFLSQNALRVAKKIRAETVIGEKTVSIGHAAIDLSRKIFTNLSDKNLLLLGAGDMARVTGLYAKKVGLGNIHIINRSMERAQVLARELGGAKFASLDELEYFLSQSDIVVTAISSEKPLITAELLTRACAKRRNKPLYIVDIAIPRNVENACGQIEEVYLFELDDLQHYVRDNLTERELAAKQAEYIIEASLEKFCRRFISSAENRLIARFHEYTRKLIFRESRKSLKHIKFRNLSAEQRELIEKMLSSIERRLTADFAIAVKNMQKGSQEGLDLLISEIVKPLTVLEDSDDKNL